MSYESKDELIFGRQLAAQSVHVGADLVAGTSDLPGRVVIDNSTIGATTVTVDIKADVKKCFKAVVTDKTTGLPVEIAGPADISVAQKITVTLDATGITDCDVEVVYEVAQ